MRTRNADGTLHFGELSKFSQSPLHFLEACKGVREPTRAMRIGTATHHLVLGDRQGQRVVRFDGTRRGAAWEAFKAERAGAEIITSAEFELAEGAADAVRRHSIAGPMIEKSHHEVPLKWQERGIVCSTHGVDLVGFEPWIGELKTTTTVHPERWERQMISRLYHAQIEWYRGGCEALTIPVEACFVFGVEIIPPHAVIVHQVSKACLELGRKSVTKWLEELAGCEANNHWPGYPERIHTLEAPAWDRDEEVDDGDEEGEAA